MKKVLIVITSIIVLVLIGVGGYFCYQYIEGKTPTIIKDTSKENSKTSQNKNTQTTFSIEYSNDYEKGHLTQIDGSEFKDLIENKKSFLILFSQTTCGHCSSFKPVLKEFASDYDIPIVYMEINEQTQEDKNYIFEQVSITATPTLTYFYEGKELNTNRLIGVKTKNEIFDYLSKIEY